MNNREQWLNTITNKYLRPHFASKGYTIPANIRLSCSQSSGGIHTKKHQKRFTLGECYPASMSNDNDNRDYHCAEPIRFGAGS
jgi:hypothetical protein